VAPLEIIYDHAGVRKRKDSSQPTFYPNQYLTDIGGGAGGQFKHIFLGSLRILTMKVIPPPDKQQWYYHPDHLGSTSIVTNENGQLAEHTHYFPYGEVWLQERSSTPVPYLFSAKEFDPETGLYDFGARYLNLTRQTDRGTSNITHYVYDEANRLACVHKGTRCCAPASLRVSPAIWRARPKCNVAQQPR
jgi:uncharacterized protein RhaS with RHS repeats